MNRKSRYADVVIAGGGASGLAAAIELGMKAPGFSVLVIEKMADPGRKIRATGSGRCNISNTNADDYERIQKFFEATGILTRTYENGLVYPYSESAADVVKRLAEKALSLGVRFACGEEIMSVKHLPAETSSENVPGSGNVFLLESVLKDRDGMQSITTQAAFTVLAMGGKAGPTLGTVGDGYRIARNLGHKVITPVPALTGIECSEWNAGSGPQGIIMAGTRTKAAVSLYKTGNEVSDNTPDPDHKLFEESGEVQFTKYGLSGICVFNMTRHMRYDRKAGESPGDFLVKIDLFPDGDIGDFLRCRRSGALKGEKIRNVLLTVLKESIASYVIAVAGMIAEDGHFGDRELSDLTDQGIDAIRSAVHELSFHPSSIRGWNDAQVTMGGVSLEEIGSISMESELISGLYITGELADRDFPCGGYNLSNAWLTGIAAADDIAQKLLAK